MPEPLSKPTAVPDDAAQASWQKLLAPWLAAGSAAPPNLSVAIERILGEHPELCAQLQQALDDPDADATGESDVPTGDPAATVQLTSTAKSRPVPEANTAPSLGRFGEYDLLQEVGRGGMGVVFKALQNRLGRCVALKMILAGQLANDTDVRRFQAEAASAAKLDHPHIVPIYEVGETEGRHYFSMGYVDGPTLDHVLKMQPLPADSAAEIVRKIALAVAYAHEHGIIHRDLKPSNILIDMHGEPKIADFGLAKWRDAQGSDERTGDIIGTPQYAAPEQAAGRVNEVQETADVYGLGAILYACVTGRPPFQEASWLDTILSVMEAEAPPPRKLNPHVPQELEAIILRCLEKKPDNRYTTAQAVADDLERFLLGEPLEAQRTSPWQRVRRWWRRQPTLVAHLAVVGTIMSIQQALHWSIGGSHAYLINMTLLCLAWALASVFFQQMLERPAWAETGRYLWAATDAALVTLGLLVTGPPATGLLIGYPLLVVSAALFFRVRLVLFMVAACLVCFGVLVYAEPAERTPYYPPIYYSVGLLAMGLIVAYQVHRIRVLSRYYRKEVG